MPAPGAEQAHPSTVAIIGSRHADIEIERSELGELADIVVGDGLTPDDIVSVGADADVILAGSGPRFDADVLKRLTCRAIVRTGVGVDSIDLEAAERRGYWVAHVPDYGIEAVAWHAMTLIAAGMRRLTHADRVVRRGDWGIDELRPLHAPSGATLGIVGFGRIGRRVFEMTQAIGFARTLVHDPHISTDESVGEWVSLETLLGEAHVITLHAPGSRDGPLLNSANLGLLRPDSVLVNTSRGSLIDLEVLKRGLARGRPGIAALDVFPTEPPRPEAFAAVADRVILTPHMAWYTEESEEDLRRKSAREARRLLLGQEPLHVVVRPGQGRGGGKESL